MFKAGDIFTYPGEAWVWEWITEIPESVAIKWVEEKLPDIGNRFKTLMKVTKDRNANETIPIRIASLLWLDRQVVVIGDDETNPFGSHPARAIAIVKKDGAYFLMQEQERG